MNKYTKRKATWGMVFVAFVVGVFVGYSVVKARVNGRIEATVAVVREQLDSAKLKLREYSIRDEMTEKNDDTLMIKVKENPATTRTALIGVNGTRTTGEGYLLREEGMLSVWAKATLQEPTAGAFYEVWLVNPTAKPQAKVSLGRMLKDKDGGWSIAYSSNNLYEGYTKLVVTREMSDDDMSETSVLEGTFK